MQTEHSAASATAFGQTDAVAAARQGRYHWEQNLVAAVGSAFGTIARSSAARTVDCISRARGNSPWLRRVLKTVGGGEADGDDCDGERPPRRSGSI